MIELKRWRPIRLATLALAVALIGLLWPRATTAQSGGVSIQNFSFQPANLTVPAGSTVVWTNQDSVAHTSTSDNLAWASGNIPPGGSFRLSFINVGSFAYHCSIHSSMHGTITVEAPPAPTGSPSGPPPPPAPSGGNSTNTPTIAPTTTSATATPTVAPARASLQLKVTGSLRVGKRSSVTVTVRESRHHHLVSGAAVTLSGGRAGIAGVHRSDTNGHGQATLRRLKPSRHGVVVVTASKSGLLSGSKSVRV